MTDRNRLREDEELAVGPLLARAKLFRVRQQWDEAIAACTDVLRRYPVSVTACSLLGEIYEAQGRLEDATQWYAMALERDGQSITDRNGWERVMAAQRARQPIEPAPKPPEPASTTLLPVAEKTLDWLDRLFPPGDNRSIARMLYAVSAVIAVLLLAAWGTFYLFFQNQSRKNLPDLPFPGTVSAGLPTPVVVEPTKHVAITEVASPKTQPSEQPASPSPLPSTGNPDDLRLLAEVNRTLNGDIVLQSLSRNATNGVATMELLVPAGENLEKSRELVLRAGCLTAKLIGQYDPSLQAASLKIFTPSLTNATEPTAVFSGDVNMASLRSQDPEQLGLVDLLSRFTRLQWEGPLATFSGPNSTTTGGNGSGNNPFPNNNSTSGN